MKKEDIVIKQVANHRNGIFGEPFDVVLFDYTEDEKVHPMVAIMFDSNQCAVLDVDETKAGNIFFACGNSWRGDVFEPFLRNTIEEHKENE
jgi:hypothetical protein